MRVAGLCTVPSWGYMVDQNATTIWERWDAYVAGRGRWGGHQHPIMNSLNHFAFGSVGEWVWRELAGINPDANDPGYKRFVIRPRPCGDLTWLKASYDSIRGTITSEWKVVDRAGFHLDVQIGRHGDRLMEVLGERGGRPVYENPSRQPVQHSFGVLMTRELRGDFGDPRRVPVDETAIARAAVELVQLQDQEHRPVGQVGSLPGGIHGRRVAVEMPCHRGREKGSPASPARPGCRQT